MLSGVPSFDGQATCSDGIQLLKSLLIRADE